MAADRLIFQTRVNANLTTSGSRDDFPEYWEGGLGGDVDLWREENELEVVEPMRQA